MYCKKCGKEAHDNDRFCSGCGNPLTPVKEEANNSSNPEEEAVKKPSIDTSEFVWDVHDFNKPVRKVENVTVDWEKGTVIEVSEGASFETIGEHEVASEVVVEAAKEEISQDIETEEFAGIEVPKIDESFAWTAPIRLDDIESALLKQREETATEDIPVTIEDIQKDVETPNHNRERDTARIDKFYTLNKKNEEFQKLLDMEYERIKAGREGTYIVPGVPLSSFDETPKTEEVITEEPQTESETQVAVEPEVFDPVAHLKKAEEERNAALGIGAGLSGMAEAYDRAKHVPVYDENGEEMRIFDTMELQKDLLEAEARSKNELINEISEKIATTKEDVERTYSSLLDDIFGQIAGVGAGAAISEAISDSQEKEEVEADVPASEIESEIETEPAEDAQLDTTDETELPERDSTVVSFYDDDEPKKKSAAGKVILAIVLMIFIFECAILGIKYLLPESQAAAIINDKLAQIAEIIKGDDGDKPDAEKTDNQDDELDDKSDDATQPVIDERAAVTEDKTAVISSLASVNENISSITYSADVKYDANYTYNSTVVHNSKPLEDNILYTAEDGTVYYVDEEVLKTLIAYNSGWIDYVNSRDDAIFDVLKTDSDAYKNTKAFSSKNITKSFESLQIGEIRKDASGDYFVWAKESISTTSGGKTTTDEYNWVYHMELINGKLLIVDYYK